MYKLHTYLRIAHLAVQLSVGAVFPMVRLARLLTLLHALTALHDAPWRVVIHRVVIRLAVIRCMVIRLAVIRRVVILKCINFEHVEFH